MKYKIVCLAWILFALIVNCSCDEDDEDSNDPKPEEMKMGFKTITKVGQGICWYEYLFHLPDLKNPKTKKFGSCYMNLRVERLLEVWQKKKYPVDDYDFVKPNVGANVNKYVKTFLPPNYYDACRTYLLNPIKKFDEENPLVEEMSGDKFPYRGWANCMLNELQTAYGEDANNALKTKWAPEQPEWTAVLLERENLNRKRHGSQSLEINEEIAKSSQQLSEELVKACGNYSDVLTEHDMMYKDEPMGMSIYLWNVGRDSPPQNDALHVANTWYESGQHYPWPEYTGHGTDTALQQFGQFSQSIWNSTHYVGYGMGRSETCNYTIFVGQYFPRGNVLEHFKENVFPIVEPEVKTP